MEEHDAPTTLRLHRCDAQPPVGETPDSPGGPVTASSPSILPGTSRRVGRIGLGAMHLSLPGRPERSDAIGVIQRAVELGVKLIDTADAYSIDAREHGHNEVLVVEALRDMGIDPQEETAPVVATKGGRSRPDGDWALDARPERIRDACHDSLRRTGLDRIPLYHLHQPDPDVPFKESVGALERLVQEGKIEAVGLSNVSVSQLEEAREIVTVATVQNGLSPWSVGLRPPPVLARCETLGILHLAYGPLGGRDRAPSIADCSALQAEGRRLGASPQELVLAWLLTLSSALLPIPGARRVASVESSVRAATIELDSAGARRVGRALASLPGREGLLTRVLGRLGRLVRRALP